MKSTSRQTNSALTTSGRNRRRGTPWKIRSYFFFRIRKASFARKYLGIITKRGQQAAEVHGKDFMIRHKKMLRLGDDDVKILETLRDREAALLEAQQR